MLIPALLIVFLVLAVKFGSFQAYVQLLSRQTYTSFLPALGAGYALVMLIFQLGRTDPLGPLPALSSGRRTVAQPHRHHPRLQ